SRRYHPSLPAKSKLRTNPRCTFAITLLVLGRSSRGTNCSRYSTLRKFFQRQVCAATASLSRGKLEILFDSLNDSVQIWKRIIFNLNLTPRRSCFWQESYSGSQ